MLTQLAAEVFGQAAPSNHNEPAQPNKLHEAAVRFADIVVDGAVQEALNLQGIVDAVRADVHPERLAKFVVNAFGDALIERNYAAAKQRKCDLNAVLKAAIAHHDFVVAAAGLQANAKAARGHGKPAKTPKAKTLSIDGIEVQEEQTLEQQCEALIGRLCLMGYDVEADEVVKILKGAGIIA